MVDTAATAQTNSPSVPANPIGDRDAMTASHHRGRQRGPTRPVRGSADSTVRSTIWAPPVLWFEADGAKRRPAGEGRSRSLVQGAGIDWAAAVVRRADP